MLSQILEGELEKFDPKKHRMLEDRKSWVLKEVLRDDWVSAEAKIEYPRLVNRVIAANPGMPPQQAIERIHLAEQEYDYPSEVSAWNDPLILIICLI